MLDYRTSPCGLFISVLMFLVAIAFHTYALSLTPKMNTVTIID
jgi:hypothetical protein